MPISNWNDFTLLSGMTILKPFRVPRSDWIESQGGRRSHKVGQLLKFTAAPHLLVKLPQAPAKTPNLQGMSKLSHKLFYFKQKMGGPRVWIAPIHKKRVSQTVETSKKDIEPSSCGGSGCLRVRCVSAQSSGGWRYQRVARLQEVLAKSYRDLREEDGKV